MVTERVVVCCGAVLCWGLLLCRIVLYCVLLRRVCNRMCCSFSAERGEIFVLTMLYPNTRADSLATVKEEQGAGRNWSTIKSGFVQPVTQCLDLILG